MNKSYSVLPCNGLDKCAGCVSKEVALLLTEETDSKIICPVFYRVADAKYNKLLQETPLLVIDGCATRCASKLAAEKNLKITQKINISEEAKAAGLTLSDSLRIGDTEKKLAENLVKKLIEKERTRTENESSEATESEATESEATESETTDHVTTKKEAYEIYKKDKFVFRLPKKEGFYFNENDVWAYVTGRKARIGVTDYAQKSLSDIMFFTPPAIGAEIEQFEEAGNIESGKAVFEIISPVSGRITAINESLLEAPELINQNPYEEGWIAELELTDFESDKELLHSFEGYFQVMKRKVDEFHV